MICGSVLGVIYWSITWNGNAFRCVYGDAVCSLTVATWILVVATSLAFIAAFKAAKEATNAFKIGQVALETERKTLRLERTPLLGERPCTLEDHKAWEEKWWIFGDDLERSLEEPKDIKWQKPKRHDFFNLGRSALLNPTVGVNVKASIGERQYSLSLPGIPTNQDVHVTFYVAESLGIVEVTFFWDAEGDDKTVARIMDAHGLDDPDRTQFFPQTPAPASTVVSMTEIMAANAAAVPSPPDVPQDPKP